MGSDGSTMLHTTNVGIHCVVTTFSAADTPISGLLDLVQGQTHNHLRVILQPGRRRLNSSRQ